MPEMIGLQAAASLVRDGDHVLVGGSGGGHETTGLNRLAQPGLVKRVVSAGFNNCRAIGVMAAADEIEAYTLPQSALSQLCRDMAAGRPGLLTRTGLHTFVDPRSAAASRAPGRRKTSSSW
jgi:propionate CoA-transferase